MNYRELQRYKIKSMTMLPELKRNPQYIEAMMQHKI